MTDQKFLWWLHERLVHVHGQCELVDYMGRLRAIIAHTPPMNETPRVASMDADADVLRKRLGDALIVAGFER